MIVRVWGTVNETFVEFHPLEGHPDFWEGFAPRVPGLQDLEIYAETDDGARVRLQTTVMVNWYTETTARITLYPYVMSYLKLYETKKLPRDYNVEFKYAIEVD